METSIFDFVPDNVITHILTLVAAEARIYLEKSEIRRLVEPIRRLGRTSRRMRRLVYDAEHGALFIWGRFDVADFTLPGRNSRALPRVTNDDAVRAVPANILRLCQHNSMPIDANAIAMVVRKMPQLVDIRLAGMIPFALHLSVPLADLPCRKLAMTRVLFGGVMIPPSVTSLELRTPVDFAVLGRAACLPNITRLSLCVQDSNPVKFAAMPSLKRLKLMFLVVAKVDWCDCPSIEKLKLVYLVSAHDDPLESFDRSGCRTSIRRVHMSWQSPAPLLNALVGCPLLERVDCDGHMFELSDVPELATVPGICNFGLHLKPLMLKKVLPDIKTYLARIPVQTKLKLSYGSHEMCRVLEDIFTSPMCANVQTLEIILLTPTPSMWNARAQTAFNRYVAEHVHKMVLRRQNPRMHTDQELVGIGARWQSFVIALMEPCVHLASLRLHNPVNMYELSEYLPNIVGNIKELAAHGYTTGDLLEMYDLSWFSRWKSLRKLWHDDPAYPDEEVVKAVLQHCPELQCYMGNPDQRPANLPAHIRYICQ